MKKKNLIVLFLSISLPALIYFGAEILFFSFINSGAKKLLNWEKNGLLSRKYGYVWQEINSSKEMKKVTGIITGDSLSKFNQNRIPAEKVIDFPSLAAISELNELKNLHKTITIADRHGIPLARLQTTHTCVFLSDINEILISSLLTTEDKGFFHRKTGYDFKSLFRAFFSSIWKSVKTFKIQRPRGSSTIHMQVARFLLMKYDNRGYAYSEQSLSRKIQELKLAQALKINYSNQEILTTYINHCVSAGRGMRGYHDISMKLFGVHPRDLSLTQSLYLARLVKWNRHIPHKIIGQIKTSMPSLARHFKWTDKQQDTILHSLDTLSFRSAPNIMPAHSHLIDLANEYWKLICKGNGINDAGLAEMDIADPESMIRRYGNLTITLTIDYRLQALLEKLVDSRGFGPDTTIRSDIRIGSEGINLPLAKEVPPDTLRKVIVLSKDSTVRVGSNSIVLLRNDTLIQNIRYKKNNNHIRRSCFTYYRDTTTVSGQYFSYAIMNSRTRELLAYYSHDRLGSRLQSLHINRNPNGSSTSKPLIYALAYDLGVYSPTEMASDDLEYGDSCAWARHYYPSSEKPTGMTFHLAAEKNGYTVHNHHKSFDGYDYMFNHLANSNNIMAVETMYRLNTGISDDLKSQRIKSFITRCGADVLNAGNQITGPAIYTALASLCAGPSINDSIKRLSTNRYSIALGTLELSLYEQLHLFNILYDGKLIINPAAHAGLFIRKIDLAGNDVQFDDPLPLRTIFDDLGRIHPVHLGLHKRLVSSISPTFHNYDICNSDDLRKNMSNFAKSGTTDDVIKPYYSDNNSNSRTNYGLWNAVLRLNLKREDLKKAVDNDSMSKDKNIYKMLFQRVPEQEILDVTLACIGECNQQRTGLRDGKTLHSYVSSSFLKHFGVPCSSGFYSAYEQQIKEETSDRVKFSAFQEESDLSGWSKFVIKMKTGFGSSLSGEEIVFEKLRLENSIRLRGKNYRKMLKFTTYMGNESKKYLSLIEKLREPSGLETVEATLKEIRLIELRNKYVKRELEQACESLLKSARKLLN